MANNKSIQFLRGNGNNKTDTLLPGQPYYDMQNNKLYIGSAGGTKISSAKAIGSEIGSPIYEHVYKVNGTWTASSVAVILNAYTKCFSSFSPNSNEAKQDMLNLIMNTELGSHYLVIASGVLNKSASSGTTTIILSTINYARGTLNCTGFSTQKSTFVEDSTDLTSFTGAGLQLTWVSSVVTGYK